MGAGFRVFDIRMDYVVHLGFTLVAILILGFGIVTLMSSRGKAGRASLISAMGLFMVSHLIGAVSSISGMLQNFQGVQWLALLGLANRFVSMGGLGFLMIGLRDLLQRNDLLETLQEESLDDQ
jgi:hypothetical protein